jgi:hypothetical protein
MYFCHLRNATSWGCTRGRDESAAQIEIKGPYPLCKSTESPGLSMCLCFCRNLSRCLSIYLLTLVLFFRSLRSPSQVSDKSEHTYSHARKQCARICCRMSSLTLAQHGSLRTRPNPTYMSQACMQTADLASAGAAESTRAFLQDAMLVGL